MNVQDTLNERGSRYGDFTDHAIIAQRLQNVMREQNGWHGLDAVKKQALTVIADKIARILSGDPEYADNWHDIQGYAKLVEERLGRDRQTADMFPDPKSDVCETPCAEDCGQTTSPIYGPDISQALETFLHQRGRGGIIYAEELEKVRQENEVIAERREFRESLSEHLRNAAREIEQRNFAEEFRMQDRRR